MVLILHQGVDSSRQNRGRFNHAAALLLVDTGTKMLVPAAGKLIHAMVAHLDAVTSLAVDPNGIYLISGSKSY